MAVAATLAVAAPLTMVATSPAEAVTTKRVVFRAWGTPPRAMVEVDNGRTSVERLRYLPYKTVKYVTAGYWGDLQYVDMVVEDMHGYRQVGCEIRVNGVVRARDVSTYGYAWCSIS